MNVLQLRIYYDNSFSSCMYSVYFVSCTVVAVSYPTCLNLVAPLKLPFAVISISEHVIKYIWKSNTKSFWIITAS